ncbi:putative ATP-dependent RNA helicase DDX11 [Stylophora pistillata]|uniref:Putative ATP-dependent RNA helicase DDX11 n=1 Tax=Stylophora pistillata TaxID=50429 RepID=A0A2B4RNN4_STYPI|nr:putative ATP-dependent RNA helicase DDX11 [Stylophora pistillata]
MASSSRPLRVPFESNIKRYCEKSMISKKLNGFVDKYHSVQVGTGLTAGEEGGLYESCNSPLQIIESFLEALTNADKDGRIVINKQERPSNSSLKFLLLNPAVHFTTIIKEARAVVVAGGTMQPMSDFKDQLFTCAGLSSDKMVEFSCAHVIPAEHLLAVALDKGPSGKDLDFTYQSRDSKQLPGVVAHVFNLAAWRLESLNGLRAGFLGLVVLCRSGVHTKFGVNMVKTEESEFSRSTESHVNLVNLIKFFPPTQPVLRCVVMVGLPYPNIYSPELNEKMIYLDATLGPKAGQIHYENLCMKAVNQSIGRAIRHKRDFATILLLDQRYGSARIQKSLPGWISNRLQHQTRFGSAFAAIRKFFVDKRQADEAMTNTRLEQMTT